MLLYISMDSFIRSLVVGTCKVFCNVSPNSVQQAGKITVQQNFNKLAKVNVSQIEAIALPSKYCGISATWQNMKHVCMFEVKLLAAII